MQKMQKKNRIVGIGIALSSAFGLLGGGSDAFGGPCSDVVGVG